MNKFGYALVGILIFLTACQRETDSETVKSSPIRDKGKISVRSETVSGQARYVGGKVCMSCHEVEYRQWTGSHHDLAMQPANEETALGDFNGATFSYSGVTSKFFKRDGKYFVNTDGPDGPLADYEIKYAFGVDPLQQYLVEFPGGRLQALSIAWDARAGEAGGQRWFHLYPNEKIDHDDPLHWTGLSQNWNYMCSGCHSTNLKKNFDLKNNAYETSWSEIDVSCEACHGPASGHVEWAQLKPTQRTPSQEDAKGLAVSLSRDEKDVWRFVPDKNTAQRTLPLASRTQEQVCARCHSRRSVIHEDYKREAPFLDSHRLSILDENLYHADGQINQEVYVYGSFLQSKMHRAGVRCSDCHDPHNLNLKAEGNKLCAKCHASAVFDRPSHHHHESGGKASLCVSCHMPAKIFMIVDPRRDHSFRVPRPDLSVAMGAPNACNQCHEGETPKWAVQKEVEWFGPKVFDRKHFAKALHAGRLGLANAVAGLADLAKDDLQPDIARASAIELLVRYPNRKAAESIIDGLRDPAPLVRLAAIGALEIFDPGQRFPMAKHLLDDSIRAVRIEAGRVLSAVPENQLSEMQRSMLKRATEEYANAQQVNADHPSAHLNLGILYANQRKWDEAERAYKSSLDLDPLFIQGYINLADLYRFQGKDDEGKNILSAGLERLPENPEILHSLGLLLVRKKRMPEAMRFLKQASTLRKENLRFSYVYAVALNSMGQPNKALAELEKIHDRHPYDRETLLALATLSRDVGRLDSALGYVIKLKELAPEEGRFINLERQLKGFRKN